ncbi:hypothetical protein BC941DRAFT_453033 [Chlamydoabsidia padenii]|nr:hypothetical protein BC941DRAFT_453033 [Chlamydoabsidia padenii]
MIGSKRYDNQAPQSTQQELMYQTSTTNTFAADEEAQLLAELQRLKTRATQLEKRVTFAETGCTELKYLKETEPTRQLQEYEELIEKRRQDSIQSQKDQTTAKESNQMEQIKEHQKKYNALNQKASTLKAQLDKLRQKVKEKKTLTQQHDGNLVKHLQDKMIFFKLLTGLIIVDYKKEDWERGVLETFKCDHLGRNTRIQYKLILIEDHDEGTMVQYCPLLDEMNGQDLPDFLKYDLEFDKKDANFFFSKIISYLNKKQKDGNQS